MLQCSRPPGWSSAEVALHCSLPNCHHFSEQRKCFALNRKSRSGTGTHLSEQRRCSNAHGRRAAQMPKLWYQHFVSYAPVSLICRNGGPSVGGMAPCCMIGPAAEPGEGEVRIGASRIQFCASVCGCKKSGSVRQFECCGCKPGRRVPVYFFASDP